MVQKIKKNENIMKRTGNIMYLGEPREYTIATGEVKHSWPITVYWIESVNQRNEPDEVKVLGELHEGYDLQRVRQAIETHEQVEFRLYFDVKPTKSGGYFNKINVYLDDKFLTPKAA